MAGCGLIKLIRNINMMTEYVFVCVDALCSRQHFFSNIDMFFCLGLISTKQRIKCLAHGHNVVHSVSLKLGTPQFHI